MPVGAVSYQRDYNIRQEQVSIWIQENIKPDIEIYYCSKCRMPLFQHGGELVSEIPGDAQSVLPIIIKCKNKRCGRVYHVHTIVKSE